MTDYPESPPTNAGPAQAASQAAHTAKDEAATVARTAADSGRDVAGTAAEGGRRLAHDAKGEAAEVAREAGRQTRDLMGQAREQLTSQAADQQKRVAGGLRTLGTELGQMADAAEDPGVASDLAGQLADRVDAVAQWLDDREPGTLLEDVKGFARQRPGTFLAVAAIAGLAAGRLTRGIKDAPSDGGHSTELTTADDLETPLYGGGPGGGDTGYADPVYADTGYRDTGYAATPPPAPPVRQSVFPPTGVTPEPAPPGTYGTGPYETAGEELPPAYPPTFPPSPGGTR